MARSPATSWSYAHIDRHQSREKCQWLHDPRGNPRDANTHPSWGVCLWLKAKEISLFAKISFSQGGGSWLNLFFWISGDSFDHIYPSKNLSIIGYGFWYKYSNISVLWYWLMWVCRGTTRKSHRPIWWVGCSCRFADRTFLSRTRYWAPSSSNATIKFYTIWISLSSIHNIWLDWDADIEKILSL